MSTRLKAMPTRLRVAAFATLVGWVVLPQGATAQPCAQAQITGAINAAGEKLRAHTTATQPQLQAKLLKLKEANGWSDTDYEEKGYNLLEDERTAKLDATASDLLARLDQLGAETPNAPPDCGRLAEIEAVGIELQATIKAKSQYILARLDTLLAAPKSDTKTASQLPAPAATPIAPSTSPPAATPKAQPTSKADPRWATETRSTPVTPVPQPPVAAMPPPPPPAAAPAPAPVPPVAADHDGYTIDEIVAASNNLFGKVSSNLARVLEHAFAKSGKPAGYILGKESGGAFIAGLRYGSGTLHMRNGDSTPIYWHGPSLGADIGAQGAATLFLVYRAANSDEVYSNFTGIEGSAFVVGGVGITFMSNGNIDMAPIRSGLGLRVGANLGYVRFTRKPTWNPF
jgi:hypothetical protein